MTAVTRLHPPTRPSSGAPGILPFASWLILITFLGSADHYAVGQTVPFEAPKFGVKASLPAAWKLIGRERDEYIFVTAVPQADPLRPGVCACELGLAPENLDEYRTRIDANAKQGRRPGTL